MIRAARWGAILIAGIAVASQVQAAEGPYPFEGSWNRSDRACSANTTRERVYTAHDVTSSRGRCTIRKIVRSGMTFELFERCERPQERPMSVREIIRMSGPDAMVLTRETVRLKLSRSLHFTRCAPAAAVPAAPPKPGIKPTH